MTNAIDPNNSSHDASGQSTAAAAAAAAAAATRTDSKKRHKTSSGSDACSDGVEVPNDSKRIMSIHDKERPTNQAPMEESISSLTSPPPPKYGSISYWDERYQKQFSLVAQQATTTSSSNAPTSDGNRKDDDSNLKLSNGNDVSTLPYHSWYFTYDELRPILLPLLLGERLCPDVLLQPPVNNQSETEEPNARDGNGIILQDQGERKSDEIQRDDENLDEGDNNDHEQVEECDDDDGEWEEVAEEGDDDNEQSDMDDDDVPVREGLAKDGPVSILEIGCGDVPLGAGLALEFQNLTATTPPPPLQSTASTIDYTDDKVDSNLSIISKIICTDYSPVVVDMMNRQYRTTELDDNENAVDPSNVPRLLNQRSDAPIQFEVVDARQLPYDDSSFHMVLEKGTLDAVLSDTVKGIPDCVQIVSECARVTRGCIVIVSHLNAHTPNGLGWLEEVVMEGLKKYSVGPMSDAVSWEIEVHGNAEVVVDDDDDNDVDNEDKNGLVPTGANGPAVYVIHKLMQRVEPSTETIVSPPQQRHPEVEATKAAASSIASIVTENGAVKSLEDDVVDVVPINVRFFSY